MSICACDAFLFRICVFLVLWQEKVAPFHSSNYLDILLLCMLRFTYAFTFLFFNVFAVNYCDVELFELLQSRC